LTFNDVSRHGDNCKSSNFQRIVRQNGGSFIIHS